jgi:hypothetical protein
MSSSSRALRRRVAVCALFALLATVSTANRGQQAADNVTLAWDASNGARGYRVHVGTESRVYDQSYDAGRTTSFVFSTGTPGTRYFFTVTAYDADGRESPPSNEVSIRIDEEPESPVIAQSCVASNGGSCHDLRVRAEALGPVQGMAPLPDGRMLFVENTRRVRVLAPRGIVAAPSLSVDDPDAELTELVADPLFDRTAFVFVGATEPQRDGQRDFRVIRYRLVHDTLGEGATIVGGLSFRGEQVPRFTVDDAGRIYVAMPGGAAARTDPYAGRVLRFAADGSVPDDQRGLSPIFADGLPVPLDLDWDGRVVWMVGLDERSQPAIGRLLLDSDDPEWPRRLSGAGFDLPPDLGVFAFDVTVPNVANRASAAPVIIDTTRRLHRVTTRERESVARLEAMDWSADGVPVDVAVGQHGSIHVVIRTAAGAFAVIQVTDRQ